MSTPENELLSFLKGELGGIEKRLFGALEDRLAGEVPSAPAAPAAPAVSRASVVGTPDVDPEAGPEFYVHLADGSVVVTKDSASTHLPGADGEPVAVIGRYQKGA